MAFVHPVVSHQYAEYKVVVDAVEEGMLLGELYDDFEWLLFFRFFLLEDVDADHIQGIGEEGAEDHGFLLGALGQHDDLI